jgi:hypothetical protein
LLSGATGCPTRDTITNAVTSDHSKLKFRYRCLTSFTGKIQISSDLQNILLLIHTLPLYPVIIIALQTMYSLKAIKWKRCWEFFSTPGKITQPAVAG